MSLDKKIYKQLNLQEDFDRVGSRQAAIKKKKIEKIHKQAMESLKERDDPWKDLGPDYEEEYRKREERQGKERKAEKQRRKSNRDDINIKRRNFDNKY